MHLTRSVNIHSWLNKARRLAWELRLCVFYRRYSGRTVDYVGRNSLIDVNSVWFCRTILFWIHSTMSWKHFNSRWFEFVLTIRINQSIEKSPICKNFVVCDVCWFTQAAFFVGCHIHAMVLLWGGALGRCSIMSMRVPHLGHLNGVLAGSGLSRICFFCAAFKSAWMIAKVAFARGCMKP